jgi:hypothetical protein
MTTLMGKSKSWWHRRLDFIFMVADEGEDIPLKALTYGVQGSNEEEELRQANRWERVRWQAQKNFDEIVRLRSELAELKQGEN